MASKHFSQTIVGILFWLLLVVLSVVLLRYYANDVNYPTDSQATKIEKSSPAWFVDVENGNQKLLQQLKSAGYVTKSLYTYRQQQLDIFFRLGPYSTRAEAAEKMKAMVKRFAIKAKLVASTGDN